MKVINALKSVCDLLLFFTVATLFKPFSHAEMLIGTVLLAVFASTLLVQLNDSLPLRIVCGLLPAAALFAAGDRLQLIFTAVFLLFYFVITVSGSSNIHYEDYRPWFGVPAFFICCLLFYCVSIPENFSGHRLTALCCFLYLFLGILVLRRKRMGAGVSRSVKLINTAELAGVAVFGAAAIALLREAIVRFGGVLKLVFAPIGHLLRLIAEAVDKLYHFLYREVLEDTEVYGETLEETLGFAAQREEEIKVPGGDPVHAWADPLGKALVCILLLALAFLIVFIVYKIVKGLKKNDDAAAEAYEDDDAVTERGVFGRKKKKRKISLGFSNGARVREIYRRYLAAVKKRGVEIARRTTSADVLEESKKIRGNEEDEALRAIYIRARYSDPGGISSEDVRTAEALWKTIKERMETG